MSYQTFLGIDIGKNEFFVAAFGNQAVNEYTNNQTGWSKFFHDNFALLKESLVVMESTGGYERGLLTFLVDNGIVAHRADTRKVKNFIRSYGQKAKTDKIDSLGLALYAKERHSILKPYKNQNTTVSMMKSLEERRLDLTQMLVQEKNRAKAPLNQSINEDIQRVIGFLNQELELLNNRIKNLIEQDSAMVEKKKVLMEIPGVGEKTAHALMALVPELGHINRKAVASLCGVAPHARQSGTKTWYSRTVGGRRNMRPILFLAAMGARRTKTHLSEFYIKLINAGKKKMVALTALMRKIVVIANAKLRDLMLKKLPQQI